jgi:hypothetical protein
MSGRLANQLRGAMDALHADAKESVTIKTISAQERSVDDDVTTTYESASAYATSVQEITDEMRHERPGWFDTGTHVAYFKYDVPGVSLNNEIVWSGGTYRIVRVRKESALGSVVYQEALLEKSE